MNIPSKRPRIGIALSGGSARGIAHIGVLQSLIDHNIPVDCISGTSAGSVVATGFAFGIPLEKLREKAEQINWYNISNFPTSALGLVSNQAVEKIMEEFIGAADISEAKIPLAIIATDIETGEKVVFRTGKAALAVRASTCIPGLFVPVEIAGRKLVDGELSESLPLSPLRDMNADIRIGVNVVHWHSKKKVSTIFDIMSNAIDITANHQKEDPLQYADLIIEPNLGDYGSSDFKKTDAMINEGYRAATLKIPEIKRLLARAQEMPEPETLIEKIRRWFTNFS